MSAIRASSGILASVALFALAAPAAAATYVIDDFTSPATPAIYSLVGPGTVVDGLVSPAPPTLLNVVSDVNPDNALTTVTVGGGALTLASPARGRAYVQSGYGAFAGGPYSVSVDSTPYHFVELSFSRGNAELNINEVMYSGSPTGPLIYYISNGVNVLPAPGNQPFNVFIPIVTVPGFNLTDVNGFLFEIDVAGDSLGSSWAIDRYALTSTVPEPGAWALLLAGMATLGAVARRRRRGDGFATGPA